MSDENNFRDPLRFTTATSMATQTSDNVDIDGGRIRGTRIGEVRQSYGNFSELYINGAPVRGGATVSATPPSDPNSGQFWWDTVGGQLYLWFEDVDSNQWVPATNQTQSSPSFGQDIEVLASDPLTGPGADRVRLYAIDNGDGTANLRMQAGTSAIAKDIIVRVGGGV